MTQFLEHDSRKEYPAGYGKHLRNLFDPDDDERRAQECDLACAPSQENQEEFDIEPHQGMMVGRKPPASLAARLEVDEAGSQEEMICGRKGCYKKPRFDSVFCSDSCGVSALERDLLRAMYVAEEMHPSLMRA